MNNKVLKTIKLACVLLFITGMSLTAFADAPPPPPGDPSQGGNGPVGGGAPVGSGIVLLLTLGAFYGGKKVYDASNSKANS